MIIRNRVALFLLAAGAVFSPAWAQYTQAGAKLTGTGGIGTEAGRGWSVAISGDGNTAAVGAPFDGGNTGAVWIFTRVSGAWSQQGAKLVGSGAIGPSRQGIRVSLSTDGNTLAVAGNADNSGAGAVWIFTRANGAWSQQGSKLVGAGAVGASGQGNDVAISGDGNTLVIGGPGDAYPTGAAWIFNRANGVWTQQGSKLLGTGAVGAALQGDSVSISADGNTFISGGPSDNGGTGATWVFARSGGAWSQQAKLVGTGAVGAARQGYHVALSGDGRTAMVGGNNDNGNTGAAWIFSRGGGNWAQEAKLTGAGATGSAPLYLGYGVAISADGNTAVAGGYGDNNFAGATWVFTRLNGIWSQAGPKLVGSGAVGASEQGFGVAVSADGKTVVAGAPADANVGGAAWVFSGSAPAAAPLPASVTPASGSGASQTFTFSFADAGGYQNLTVLDFLIRDVLDGRQACYVAFVPSGANAGSVYLVKDAGDAGGPYSGMVLPGSGAVNNGQCTITGTGSVVSGSGNTLSVTLPITFTPGFAGNKVIYMAAQDAAANSGWRALGVWNIPGAAVTGPAVSGVTPGHASGLAQNYSFAFTDTNGWQDIQVVNVLVNDAINGIRACYVAFVPSGATSGALYLVDDAGNAGGPYSGMVLPGSGSVGNSQCAISGAGSSVSASGNSLTLNLAITFTSSFAGNRVLYLASRSATRNSGWQAAGTVGVQ
jgi:hypothetical protein